LNNSSYDQFHGGGDFSYACVIMKKYFDKKSEMQKINTHVFLHENILHILSTFEDTIFKSSEYKKNNQMKKKMNHFFVALLK